MKHVIEYLIKESGFRLAERIDIQERGITKILVPFEMVDEMAGWRDSAFESNVDFETVGTAEGEEEDFSIQALYAKTNGTTLEIIVAWKNNLRVSRVTTTLPHTVFWQGTRHFKWHGGVEK